MRLRASSGSFTSLILLSLYHIPITLAHGDSDEQQMHGGHGAVDQGEQVPSDVEYPPTYFAHPDHVAILYGHIALMILAWVFALPVAVMLSLAKSRYTLLSQGVFTAANGVGVFLATIYNAQTPDLYPGNAHHSIGWVVTWVAFAQLIVSGLRWIAVRALAYTSPPWNPECGVFLPVSSDEAQTHARHNEVLGEYRSSGESSSGSESSRSIRSSSSASTVIDEDEGLPMPIPRKEYGDDDDEHMEEQALSPSHAQGTWKKRAVYVVSSRPWSYFALFYQVIDRIVLPLGFIALTSGIAVVGRFFEGKAIFNGMAHWVKGGVFFWLGLFTLGRWAGNFGDLGWAWNIRPGAKSSKWRPSAEFVESALIFFYGATNIFMEHMSGWGKAWHAQDFEHLAITVLFIGGGLCGMLIESTQIRSLLNATTVEAIPERACSDVEEQDEKEEPATYKFSLNPIPALVILLLGIMMGSHHQKSMISTMVHKQWGNLLVGASFARGLTYVLVFLRPPTSVLPSRPPTELLASFGLIAGGVVFMASSADTIQGMIHYELDAMFMYTVTLGFVGLLMAWELIVLAIKGLATRSQRRAKLTRFE